MIAQSLRNWVRYVVACVLTTCACVATALAADTTKPTAPSGLTATVVSGTQITLNWTASTDNVGVTGYRVERCQSAGCTSFALIASPATTSYSDTALVLGTTYLYRVTALDAAGNQSPASAVASAATQFGGPVTYTYSYDSLGRITQASGSNGSIVSYSYDANGNMTVVNRQ